MNYLYVLLFIITVQQSFLRASWQVSLEVELYDTQLQNLSVGVQQSNKFMKKFYLDTLFFKLCYEKQAGIYFNVELDEHKEKKSKKYAFFDYAARSFSLALIKKASFSLKNCYKETMQQSPSDINISSTKRSTRLAIPFESTTKHVIDGYIAGILPGDDVKELYTQVQKALIYTKDEQKRRLCEVNHFGMTGKRLVMINGKLSFYNDIQELSKKIDTLEKLAKKLEKFC